MADKCGDKKAASAEDKPRASDFACKASGNKGGGGAAESSCASPVDKCIADGIIKAGGGLVGGGALSFFVFRRRLWPVLLGLGIGTGMAIANCQDRLKGTSSPQKSKGGACGGCK